MLSLKNLVHHFKTNNETKGEFLAPNEHSQCLHMHTLMEQHTLKNVCVSCNKVVVAASIDEGCEWRAQTKQSGSVLHNNERCGIINPLFPKSTLSTKIARTGKPDSRLLIKMNKWNAMDGDERSIYAEYKNYDEKLRKQCISKHTIFYTKMLFKRIYMRNREIYSNGGKRLGLRGKKRDQLRAGCLYVAALKNKEPISKLKIAEILELQSDKFVNKGVRLFWKIMEDEVNLTNIDEILNPKDFIHHFGKKLESKLNHQITKYALQFYKYVKTFNVSELESELESTQPQFIALACIIVVTREIFPNSNIDFKSACAKFDVTFGTVRKIIKLFSKHKRTILTHLLIDEFSCLLDIRDAPTRHKMKSVAKHVSKFSELTKFSVFDLAKYSMYFVIYFTNLKNLIQTDNKFDPEILMQIHREVFEYKDALIKHCIEPFTFRE